MPLFTESGGIDFDTLRHYCKSISSSLNLKEMEEWLIADVIKVTWKDDKSRNILIFFTINLAFFFVELLYGYFSGSLGLMSDAFHMLFDCAALFIGLIAAYISKLDHIDKLYTYGYGKIETISGLFNGIFLIFISFNIFCESVERIFDPIKIKDEGLITVCVLGLIVNMIGLFFFHDFHHHHEDGGTCPGHGHSHSTAEAGAAHQHHHGHHHHHHMPLSQDDQDMEQLDSGFDGSPQQHHRHD